MSYHFPQDGSQVPPPPTAVDPDLVKTMLDRMRVVKRARFNAAQRLESKASFALFSQSVVALYLIGLAVWQVVYAQQLGEANSQLLTFIQIVSSVFLLMMGLLEAKSAHGRNAQHLQNCALAVSDLLQEFEIERPSGSLVVRQYSRRYNHIIRECPVNHDDIDLGFAEIDDETPFSTRIWLRVQRFFDVYGLYINFIALPPVIWFLNASA